jgi:DNA polymerase III subunit beta
MVAIATTLATIPTPSAPLSIPRKTLSAALAVLLKATDPRSSIAVLADLCFTAGDMRQRITATNLNASITYTAPHGGAPVSGVTIKAKLFADMVKSATGDVVELAKSGNGITLACNGSDTTMLGTDMSRDYPKIPALPEAMDAIDADALADGLDTAIHAVCKDETRFHLNGVLIEAFGINHTLVSTDGHRLVRVKRDAATVHGTGILPAAAAAIVVKLLRSCQAARAAIVKHKLHVSCLDKDGGSWECSFKMIDAQFPPYEQVIPKDYSKLVTVERKPLIAAMKRAKALCTQTRGALLKIASGKLSIVADHPDHGQITEALPADGAWVEDGGTAALGVNAGYLLDALDEIDCKHITITFGGELDPVLVRGTDDQTEWSVADARRVEVIMPMRI